MKRLVLGLALILNVARADPAAPKLTAPSPAPDVYAMADWCWASSCVPGAWFTASQTKIIDAKIDYLEKKAAKDCVDQQISAAKVSLPGWLYLTGGIIVGGVVGYIAGKNL